MSKLEKMFDPLIKWALRSYSKRQLAILAITGYSIAVINFLLMVLGAML